jgi:multimeric flavodoxin WrbA
MKIVIINGSPRGLNGNTGLLVNVLTESLKNEGSDTEIVNLANVSLHPCQGCHVCSKTGSCVINDDVAGIQDTILAADGIIFASPNYLMNVSGHMKMFMDRCFTHIHCQSMVGKYGASLVTSAGPIFESIEEYLLSILGFLGCWTVGSTGAAVLQLEDDVERQNVFAETTTFGKKIFDAIKTRAAFPDQEEKRQQTFEMMKLLVYNNKEDWSHEYKYWQTRWGIEEL